MYRETYYEELADMIMEFKSNNLPTASWKPSKASDVIGLSPRA